VWLTDFIDYSLSENHDGGMKRIPVGPEWQVSTGFSAQYLFLSFPSQRCFFSSQPFFFPRPCDSDGSTRIKKKNKQMVSKSHCRERKRLEIESKEASNHKMEIPRHMC
jgi:hypothetical protein